MPSVCLYINEFTYFCCENSSFQINNFTLYLISYVKSLTCCIHTLVAECKRADKNGNHNAQFNTETTEKVGNKKTKSSKTSINIETLTKHFNEIKNTKLDEEYKVC